MRIRRPDDDDGVGLIARRRGEIRTLK